MFPLAIPTAFLGEDSLTQHSQEPQHTHTHTHSYNINNTHSGRGIRSSEFKVDSLNVTGQRVESHLLLSARIKHQLVEEGLVCLAKIRLVVLRDFSILIV